MSDQSPPPVPAEPQQEPAGKPVFAPYDAPAGGWGALHATARALREQSVELKGSRALLSMNQPDGFDCPGCAWPDPRHTSSFEFCENGAKAVTWELTKQRVTREFFAAHPVRALEQESDHWLEQQGRLTEPMRYDPATDRYVPVDWNEAFAIIGRELNALDDPNEAEFYTSGRTSNEAAFMYQLLPAASARTTFRIVRTCVTSRPALACRRASASARGQYCSMISLKPTRSSSSARTPAPTARGC